MVSMTQKVWLTCLQDEAMEDAMEKEATATGEPKDLVGTQLELSAPKGMGL